jgi:hypothetical protein
MAVIIMMHNHVLTQVICHELPSVRYVEYSVVIEKTPASSASGSSSSSSSSSSSEAAAAAQRSLNGRTKEVEAAATESMPMTYRLYHTPPQVQAAAAAPTATKTAVGNGRSGSGSDRPRQERPNTPPKVRRGSASSMDAVAAAAGGGGIEEGQSVMVGGAGGPDAVATELMTHRTVMKHEAAV